MRDSISKKINGFQKFFRNRKQNKNNFARTNLNGEAENWQSGKSGLKQKGGVVRKIKQRKIVIASSIGLLILSGIFMVVIIMNMNKLQKPGVDLNFRSDGKYENSSKSNFEDFINTSNCINDNSSFTISNEKSRSDLSTYSTSGNTKKPVPITPSDITDATGENGAYIPLQIEPAKTNEIISSTTGFFKERIPFLQQVLKDSGFFYSEKILDPNTMTKVYIIAKNKNSAENLNGYFYYLFDEKGSSTIVSPFVLNISLLFDEENRRTVIESGTYAETGHLQTLKKSMMAILGGNYSEEVFNFIFSEYKRTFSDRIEGKPLQNPVCKLQLKNLEVVFHNSFLTYVEFFISQ